MIQFATPETIKQIKNTTPLVLEAVKETDHILGASGPEWEKVLPTRNWLDFAWSNPEIQVVSDGDLFWCVKFSHGSAHRFVWRVRYNGEDFDTSERFGAIGAGTKRGVGVGMVALAEWCRKNGFLMQKECPTPNTLDEAYADLDKALFTKALENTARVEVLYKQLPDASVASILDGLQYSPVQVAVQQYAWNSKGYIINNEQRPSYIHAVDIVQDMIKDMGDFWAIWDSENKQWLPYDKSFRFVCPIIHSVKKKIMNNRYKIAGHSAVFQLDPIGKNLVPYGSGRVYKTIQDSSDYKGVIEVANLAALEKIAPLADWIITESPWDKTSFVNSLQ